jgi:hypothetical protein
LFSSALFLLRGSEPGAGHTEAVHPLSTALLLIGYGLSLPIGTKLSTVVRNQHRVALIGYQLGLLIAAGGWLLAGRTVVALAHALWFVLVRVWFWYVGRRSTGGTSSAIMS